MKMNSYRKKPIEVQAIKWDGTEEMALLIASNDDFEGMIDYKTGEFGGFYVETLDGRVEVSADVYIIKDKKNDYHVLSADVFELIYEKLN
jgi:predicted aspartyl protease